MVNSMASLYTIKKSPFWYIKAKDGKGNWSGKPTVFRWDDKKQTNQAKQLCATTTANELRNGSASSGEAWGAWVQDFLNLQYPKESKTHTRYQSAWNSLSVYLKEKEILSPRHVAYEHVMDYFPWRKKHSVLKKGASKNTALYELRVLKLLMKQAIRRFHLTMANPCAELGIKKDAPKIKPEITETDIEKIRAGLKDWPEWMQISFEIGLHQGCRLMETSLPLEHIDLEKMEIQFHAKGKKVFTTKLHQGLVPLVKKLKAEKRKVTWEPSCASQPSTQWTRFFRKIGLPQYCFHCTRVTVISRLARSKTVSERDAMGYVGHSSVEVHRIYQRLKVEDLSSCVTALVFAPSSETAPAR